ncbi:hypothetical protein BC827DRAFT_1238988 [Russula dissimulans]|nr:hypothetical protein BC827DRAFT_1238988 [Russula dissimulans]
MYRFSGHCHLCCVVHLSLAVSPKSLFSNMGWLTCLVLLNFFHRTSTMICTMVPFISTIDGTTAITVSSQWHSRGQQVHPRTINRLSTMAVTGQLNKETLHWQRRTLIELKITVACG